MLKNKLLTIAVAAGVLATGLLGWASAAQAGSPELGKNVIVRQDEVVSRTMFTAGETIEIAGTVDGDVFCAGQTITITGTVRGDVICAGQTIQTDGTVEGDVRLAGQIVMLNGKVDGNATVAAQTFTLENDATVNDLAVAASVVTLNGKIERDAYAGANSLNVNGSVSRNLQADVERLDLGGTAQVGGNVSYSSNNELARSEGAQVSGQVNRQEPNRQEQDDDWDAAQTFGGIMFMLLALLVVSMALAALFPRVLQRVTTNAVEKPGLTFVVGLVTILVAPVLIFGIMLTGIGIFLGLLLLLAFMLVLFTSWPLFGYYVGRMLLRKNSNNPLLYMLLGSTIVILLFLLPYINILVMLIAGSFGVGMVVREIMKRSVRPHYDVTETSTKAKQARIRS